MHGSTVMPTSALAPGGRVESVAAFTLHSEAEDGQCHPHSNLLHTQQVLTSRLRPACCESNSSGRHCLIRMRTDSSYPIPVF